MSPKTIDYNNAISQSIKINSSKIGTTAKSDIAGAVFKSQVATNDIPTTNRFSYYNNENKYDDKNMIIDELPSFNFDDDAQRITSITNSKACNSAKPAKKNSLSFFTTIKSCATESQKQFM